MRGEIIMSEQFDLFSMLDKAQEADAQKQKERDEKERNERQEKIAKQKAIAEQKSAEVAENKETNKKESNNKSDSSTKEPAAKVEPFAPNEATIIRYFGESIEITEYFSSEELAEGLLIHKKDEEPTRAPLTAELLRQRMEKVFPELVKDYTEMIFLAKKNLVIPTMKAKKKGNCRVLPSGDTFPLPKIPYKILSNFISVAKLYGEHELEVHADIYYQKHTKSFILDFPQQNINRYNVEVTESSRELAERFIDATKILEIHSHHLFAVAPSKQDNESERIPGMHYAIVGRINKYFPDLYIRQFILESIGHKEKHMDDIFENPFLELPNYEDSKIEVI